MMTASASTTRWRTQPIIPKDYGNVAGLVQVARQARDRIVEFDWVFSRDNLVCLQRAVYEWGSGVKGRYRCFDARVLAAIATALGDTSTAFSLSEPKSSQQTDCSAACSDDGGVFRLRGHASLDIVLGYGTAGVGQNVRGSIHLGATARETLASAVGMLGWDLSRLQEARLQPVLNALYGLPLDYAISSVVVSATGPAQDIPVHFHGPFSAFDQDLCRCLFTDEVARRSGVYLWAIEVGGTERPWYIGQTQRSFGERMGEHLRGFLSGEYPTYDPEELMRGRYALAKGSVKGPWLETLPSFLRNYETLTPAIVGLVRLLRFYVAPLIGDAHLHNRIEGAIGRYYKAHPSPELRDFFFPGLKLPTAVPSDSPIRLLLSSDTPLAGLPAEICEPRSSRGEDSVTVHLPSCVHRFVESTDWTSAKTYAATWPHEYVVRTPGNTEMLVALARHIFEHGTDGRFYSQVRKYHHEGGKVYWSMDETPEATTLINRCEEDQTYEARLANGTLPSK